jgi:hypothetical protein
MGEFDKPLLQSMGKREEVQFSGDMLTKMLGTKLNIRGSGADLQSRLASTHSG